MANQIHEPIQDKMADHVANPFATAAFKPPDSKHQFIAVELPSSESVQCKQCLLK